MHTPNGQRLIRFGGTLTTGSPTAGSWTLRLCLAGLGLAGLGLVAAIDGAHAQVIVGGDGSDRPAVEVDLSVLDALDGRVPPARITLTPPRSPAAPTAPQAVTVAAAPLWMPPLPGQKPVLSETVAAPVPQVATAPAIPAPRAAETVTAGPMPSEPIEPADAGDRTAPTVRAASPAIQPQTAPTAEPADDTPTEMAAPTPMPEPGAPTAPPSRTIVGPSAPAAMAARPAHTETAPAVPPASVPTPTVAAAPSPVAPSAVASASVEPTPPRRIDTVPHTLPTTRPPLALIPDSPPRPARVPDRSSVAAAPPSDPAAVSTPADQNDRQMASAPMVEGSSDIPASAPPVPASKPVSTVSAPTVPLPPELRVSPQIVSRPPASSTRAPAAASTPLPQRAPAGRGETAIAALDQPIALPPSPPTARTAPTATAPAPNPTAEILAEPQMTRPLQTAALPTPNQAARSTGPTLTIDTLPDGQGFRIMFDADEEDLNESGANLLEGLAQRMMNNESIRLQILSFAGGTPETASQARRLSLNRALNVRTFLIDRGVRRTRIDVRALGNTAPDDPKNRVDLLLSS